MFNGNLIMKLRKMLSEEREPTEGHLAQVLGSDQARINVSFQPGSGQRKGREERRPHQAAGALA
jgi:hypothetical protein